MKKNLPLIFIYIEKAYNKWVSEVLWMLGKKEFTSNIK